MYFHYKIGFFCAFPYRKSPCTVRFADAGPDTDISGIYTEDAKALYEDYLDTTNTVYIENDSVKAVRWFTVDGQYILVLEDSSEEEWTDFETMSNTFRELTPVTWSSDVPYETYKAMEGTYQSENGEYAGITIEIDHLHVFGMLITEEGTNLWEASAVLEGDKLVYESESMTLNVYNEDSGETTETPVYEGGAGSITVDGDNLIFDGVNCEDMAGMSFTRSEM